MHETIRIYEARAKRHEQSSSEDIKECGRLYESNAGEIRAWVRRLENINK